MLPRIRVFWRSGSAGAHGLARKMVRWGLCHVIASDAHSLEHRPANLRPALELIAKCMGRMKAQELEQNAAALYDGMMIPTGPIRTPKRVLGLWL